MKKKVEKPQSLFNDNQKESWWKYRDFSPEEVS